MFEGDFQEGAEQSTTLAEIDGVASVRSLEMLVQWICLGRIVIGATSPAEGIALSMEFARLADMCNITGVESLMAEHINGIIVADAALHLDGYNRDPNANTFAITTQHIQWATLLPSGHPVRGVLAMAIVEGFFLVDDYRFRKETREIPGFAADVLAAVANTIPNSGNLSVGRR